MKKMNGRLYMRSRTLCVLAFVALVGVVAVSTARADWSAGPGDINATTYDLWYPAAGGHPGWIMVDNINVATVTPAGTYYATSFNYQWDAGEGSGAVAGTLYTPFLCYKEGDSYYPLVIGDARAYTGEKAFGEDYFTQTASRQFTLAAPTTVYAGFLWDGTSDETQNRVDAIYFATSGSTHLWSIEGATLAIGTEVGSGSVYEYAGLIRTYDFSVTISDTDVPNIPEPATMSLLGLGGLVAVLRKRR